MTTNTALAKIERSHAAPANFGAFLDVVKPRLMEVLPAHINPEALIRVVQTFGNQNEKLLKCTEASLLTSLMHCSQLGLPPNTPQGFAWLIPFWNGRQKVMECKVMFGKNGLAELVRNSGQIHRMNSGVVYKHEVTSGAFTHTNEPPTITHRSDVLASPEFYADEHLVAAYALIETKDGARVQRVLRRDEVLKRRDASQAVQRAKEKGYRTPWDDWEGPMWAKTAIRALCGMPEVPKSTDLMTALEADIDAPDYDELQNVVLTQADGFRHQAAMATPEVAALPEGADTPPEPADKPPKDEKRGTRSKEPKKATKAQASRLWGRWAKITDCDPKKPADVDKESFRGFVAARIGEDKAGDSSLWTVDDCKAIDKGLDELRGEPPAEPPPKEGDPAAGEPAEPPEGQEQEPEISKAEALKRLKDLRGALDMPWDRVRDIATTCGVTARSSSKWTVKEILDVAKAMEAHRGAAEEPPATEPPEQEPGSDADTEPPLPPEEEPPPLEDDPPESEADPGE
jgi:phage RecT family recombinase